VNAVAPGAILGDGVRRWIEGNARANGVTYDDQLARQTQRMALRRIATEDEVANAVLFLASDLASGITGATLDVNAGQLFQ
jgi:NAD(P)-dependent dehydrogenase (short-subunit alcohol dehydrogenase family)